MPSRLINECKYWGQVLLIPVFGLSLFSKRDKNLWVLGSTFGNRFADNPRYFFYYLSQMDDEERERAGLKPGEKIRPVWITQKYKMACQLREMGYEAYWDRSPEGIKCCLRAGVYLFDNYSKDISFWLSGRARKINLWHGTPLKKIQMDNRFDKVRHPENPAKRLYWMLRRMTDEKPWHYVLTTSEFFRPIFSSAFGTKNVLVCGYPRNDCLLGGVRNDLLPGEKRKLKKLLGIMKKNPGSRLITYMPTFRDSETGFFETIDFKELSEYLEEKNICLVIKLHSKSKLQQQFKEQITKQQSYREEKSDIQRSDTKQPGRKRYNTPGAGRIMLLSPQDDPYEFLKRSDALITDYSSVYFDYLVLDRPVIFFDYDRSEYLSETRELYFDYDEFTPGRKAKNWDELKEAIENVDWENKTDGYERKRHEILKLAVDENDCHAGRRLLKAVRQAKEQNKEKTQN